MKKRILFISPLPPPVHGSAMVSKQIKDSKLINETFDCNFINLSTSRKMDEIQKFSFVKLVRLLCIYIKVFFSLLCHRYDLCYCAIACFGTPFLKDAPVVLLCKLFRRKILIHQHNKGMSLYKDKSLYHYLYHFVYKNTKVMLLSWRLYYDITGIVSKDQVCVCPNGVPPIKEVSIEEKPREVNSPIRLLYLSNLIPSKGCNALLEALRLLKERGLTFTCNFIGGDCPEQSATAFDALIKEKNLDDCAFYQGRKYGKDKDTFYRNTDVFVFPTFYPAECFPLVLLEAMQYGLPCISTTEGAIPDIIISKENGLLVEYSPDGDSFVSGIADAIRWMAEHPKERLTMGSKGKQIFQEHFSEEKFILTFIKILNNYLL